jgi:ABC-type lipoprotein export system ATPase subunit
MSQDALRFEGVWKSYPQVDGQQLHALREVTAHVEAGHKVAIIGRSGSGKSTFLHLAAGIDEPSRGEVSIFGSNLSELGDLERTLQRRQKIGLVFQFFHLLPHLDVLDNVMLPALIAGDPRRSYESRARELLGRVGLGDRTGETVEKLSGGEMQRVAICRAMLRRPSLLLADEPTGNLDDDTGRRVMELLLQLVEEEASTLIYVTHSQELATLADQTWSLHSGVLEKP